MGSLRRLFYYGITVVGLSAGAAIIAQPHALATTGPTHFLPTTKYRVGSALETLYVGQYTLKSAASGARLRGGALAVEVDTSGDLYGVGQFYAYDAQGHLMSWTATLYNFRQDSHKHMVFDLTGPAGRPLLGRLTVTRSKNGDLQGTIQLSSTGQFAILWHKISSR